MGKGDRDSTDALAAPAAEPAQPRPWWFSIEMDSTAEGAVPYQALYFASVRHRTLLVGASHIFQFFFTSEQMLLAKQYLFMLDEKGMRYSLCGEPLTHTQMKALLTDERAWGVLPQPKPLLA